MIFKYKLFSIACSILVHRSLDKLHKSFLKASGVKQMHFCINLRFLYLCQYLITEFSSSAEAKVFTQNIAFCACLDW